jgi:pyridoxine 5-phosphate synthase
MKITVIQKRTGSQYLKNNRCFSTANESRIRRAAQSECVCICKLPAHLAQKSVRWKNYFCFMLKLGVNIDHVATLREARYRGRGFGGPNPVEAARICEAAGAHGITAHLREDRRHIQDRDILELREKIETRLNLEMANAPAIISIALKLRPEIVCIVPERRLEVTTEGGLDVAANEKSLIATRMKMNDAGIEVSLFIAPDEKQIEAAARVGSQFIELHTGAFAESFFCGSQRELAHSEKQDADQSRLTSAATDFEIELQRLISGAEQARALGLKVNAGHGLNLENLPLLHRVPHLVELNIGHGIVSRAVMAGLETAVKEMLRLMENYRG